MNKVNQRLKYIFLDWFAALLSWTLFYIFRKLFIEPRKFGHDVELEFTEQFFFALLFIPLLWVFFYMLTGFYLEVYRKSRLKEFGQTLLQSFIGVLILFFALILDDEIASYRNYYYSFLVLFTIHFSLTAIFRLMLTTQTARKIHNRKMGYKTLIVGGNDRALKLYKELSSQKKSSGFNVVGFVHKNGTDFLLKEFIPHLGHVDGIQKTIKEHQIEEVILALETSEHDSLQKIINKTEGLNVFVKIIPDMYDILSGTVRMTSIFGAALIDINKEIMPPWQQSVKRIFDVSVSLLVLTFFSWLFILIGVIIKLTSKGSILYKQERIGLHGKPFTIYKFRSMHTNAENGRPQLSSSEDSRITRFGKFLRKTRLDELPQFFNVLKGEMSMVGPRPERSFFIEQIMERNPHYVHLHKVRPGITSWGQVKFGYAENVDQMVERLKYDIIYIENMSLFVDFKILIYTVLIVLRGQGK